VHAPTSSRDDDGEGSRSSRRVPPSESDATTVAPSLSTHSEGQMDDELRRKLCRFWAEVHECRDNQAAMETLCRHECRYARQGFINVLMQNGAPLSYTDLMALSMEAASNGAERIMFPAETVHMMCTLLDRQKSTEHDWTFHRAGQHHVSVRRHQGLALDVVVSSACLGPPLPANALVLPASPNSPSLTFGEPRQPPGMRGAAAAGVMGSGGSFAPASEPSGSHLLCQTTDYFLLPACHRARCSDRSFFADRTHSANC